jgi:ribokinase
MILVFGSINVDIIVPVPRLPIPGETVLGGDYAIVPGGKGANQALAARRAGADVVMVGAVGNDAFAEMALARLRQDGVELSHVKTGTRPTGCATITVDPAGENAIAVASGANRDAAASQVPDALLGPTTALVLQREVPTEENAALIRRARDRGARIVLSLAPAGPIAPAELADIDFLIANEGEATTLGAVAAIAGQVREALIVTRGAAGATAYTANSGAISVPALAIDPLDTTGAGDTFAGVFAAGIDQGLPLARALRHASAAAGLACLALGAQQAMPDRAAIDAAAEKLQA